MKPSEIATIWAARCQAPSLHERTFHDHKGPKACERCVAEAVADGQRRILKDALHAAIGETDFAAHVKSEVAVTTGQAIIRKLRAILEDVEP